MKKRSVKRKLFTTQEENESNLVILAGIGSTVGLNRLQKYLLEKGFKDEIDNKRIDENHLAKKLRKKANELGIKLVDNSGARNGGNFFRSSEKSIYLDKLGRLSPSTIAHELGHAEIESKKSLLRYLQRSKYKYNQSSTGMKTVHPLAGFAAGYHNSELRDEGKEENKALKWGTRLAPAILSIPMLAVEGGASLKGLRLLKNSGYGKDALKNSRKLLGGALLNHSMPAIQNIVSNEIGYQLGNAAYKITHKKRNSDKNDRTRYTRFKYIYDV